MRIVKPYARLMGLPSLSYHYHRKLEELASLLHHENYARGSSSDAAGHDSTSCRVQTNFPNPVRRHRTKPKTVQQLEVTKMSIELNQPDEMYQSISAFFKALTELVKVFTKKVKEDSH